MKACIKYWDLEVLRLAHWLLVRAGRAVTGSNPVWWETVFTVLYRKYCMVHCPKSYPNFRDTTWNVEENETLHEIFRAQYCITFSPLYISCYRILYIAENRLLLWQQEGQRIIISLNLFSNAQIQWFIFTRHQLSWKNTKVITIKITYLSTVPLNFMYNTCHCNAYQRHKRFGGSLVWRCSGA